MRDRRGIWRNVTACAGAASVGAVVWFLACATSSPQAAVESPSGALGTLLAALQHREVLVGSATGEFLLGMDRNTDPEPWKRLGREPPGAGSLSVRITWAFDGPKFRDEQVTTAASGVAASPPHEIHVCDGERAYEYLVDEKYATEYTLDDLAKFVHAGWVANNLFSPGSAAWLDLEHSYLRDIGKAQPLSARLADLNASLTGQEEIRGLSCFRVAARLPNAGGTDLSWWMAPDRGFLVVRSQVQYHPSASPGVTTTWVQEVEESRNYGADLWLPVRMTRTSYLTFSDGTRYWTERWTLTGLSLTVNQAVAGALFGPPKYEPGTLVLRGPSKEIVQ